MNFDGFDFDDNIKQTFNTLDIQGRVPHAVVIESRDSEKGDEPCRVSVNVCGVYRTRKALRSL